MIAMTIISAVSLIVFVGAGVMKNKLGSTRW